MILEVANSLDLAPNFGCVVVQLDLCALVFIQASSLGGPVLVVFS